MFNCKSVPVYLAVRNNALTFVQSKVMKAFFCSIAATFQTRKYHRKVQSKVTDYATDHTIEPKSTYAP